MHNYVFCSIAADGGICLFTFGTNSQCRHQTACTSDADCQSGQTCLQSNWCTEPLREEACQGRLTGKGCAADKDQFGHGPRMAIVEVTTTDCLKYQG